MDVFSWCVRPLLRQGYLQPLSQDIGAERVRSLQHLHICLRTHAAEALRMLAAQQGERFCCKSALPQSFCVCPRSKSTRPARVLLGAVIARRRAAPASMACNPAL